jgi:hypothetical protein
MPTSAVELQVPNIDNLTVTEDTLTVELSDGRTLSVPLAWYPRLACATPAERHNWRLIGKGQGIHWEDLDEDISVEGLIAGKPSGESQTSFRKWLQRRSSGKERMWVFRITRGYDGGNPEGTCPLGLDSDIILKKIATIIPTPLEYNGDEVNFILNELFENHRLRQGWGIPGLDLRLEENIWLENYIIGSRKYWSKDSTCNEAMGRKKILNHILDMSLGDIIFLPNVSENTIDLRCFTVATVISLYDFEDRSNNPNTWKKDFGHIIGVNYLKTFPYSNNSLMRDIFGPPFMHAIDPILPHYQSYNIFKNFLSMNYNVRSLGDKIECWED